MATESSRTPLLDVQDLTVHFPVPRAPLRRPLVVHAVDEVSFRIHPAEIVGLVGESGSGKSTTARVIAALFPPTAGRVTLEGVPVPFRGPAASLASYRRKVQMIFQDPFAALNPVRDVFYHLMRPRLALGLSRNRREAMAPVTELLEIVGLTPARSFLTKFPHQLSGGQRQRVVIARALAAEPRLVLADEPTSMLDVSIRMGVLNLLEDLRRERGLSYLYITHDIASARYLADRILVMYAGWVVESADADELIAHPRHPYTQLLLSAVPAPEKPDRPPWQSSRGEIPDLLNPPGGCRFHPRCPWAMEVCRAVVPRPVAVQSGHEVSCHLYPQDPARGAREHVAARIL